MSPDGAKCMTLDREQQKNKVNMSRMSFGLGLCLGAAGGAAVTYLWCSTKLRKDTDRRVSCLSGIDNAVASHLSEVIFFPDDRLDTSASAEENVLRYKYGDVKELLETKF